MNLFEGNMLTESYADTSKDGSTTVEPMTGPGNTWFRNYASGKVGSIQSQTERQHVIGNVVGTLVTSGSDHYMGANLVAGINKTYPSSWTGGTTNWGVFNSNVILPASLYLTNRPGFFGGNAPWPRLAGCGQLGRDKHRASPSGNSVNVICKGLWARLRFFMNLELRCAGMLIIGIFFAGRIFAVETTTVAKEWKFARTNVLSNVLSHLSSPGDVLSIMERVADWQLAHPSQHPLTDWTQGAGYAGVMALADITQNSNYVTAMISMGESNRWELGPRTYFADDQCVGQTYCELFFRSRDHRMIDPMRKQFDEILVRPREFPTLDFTQKGIGDLWSWCDSLFMAPPAWIRLWRATDDTRYLDFAVTNWWRTSDYLYDQEEHLFYRDSKFFNRREPNGRKLFWSRGNGWVMAGLVRILQFLPPEHPARKRFERQFKEMADTILICQQTDGLWRASLLDPESFPAQESSGSGFFVYALAWGINEGHLDRKRFQSAVLRGWDALITCVAADGRLTRVQPAGSAPKQFDVNATEVYGVGAFLLAGSQVYRLSESLLKPPASTDSTTLAR